MECFGKVDKPPNYAHIGYALQRNLNSNCQIFIMNNRWKPYFHRL